MKTLDLIICGFTFLLRLPYIETFIEIHSTGQWLCQQPWCGMTKNNSSILMEKKNNASITSIASYYRYVSHTFKPYLNFFKTAGSIILVKYKIWLLGRGQSLSSSKQLNRLSNILMAKEIQPVVWLFIALLCQVSHPLSLKLSPLSDGLKSTSGHTQPSDTFWLRYLVSLFGNKMCKRQLIKEKSSLWV